MTADVYVETFDAAVQRLPQRIAAKIEVSGDCWLWTGAISGGRYGHVRWNGPMVYAHRLVRHLLVGDVEVRPADLLRDQLDHLCRNTRCVHPGHLERVTQRENIMRGQSFSALNAAKNCCPYGHPLELAFNDGRRRCLVCHRRRTREGNRRYYAKRKARP